MRKSPPLVNILFLTFIVFCIYGIFFIRDIFILLDSPPVAPFGQLILRDGEGTILTDKGGISGYTFPYKGENESLVNNIIAIEDKRFWQHSGVDWRGKVASLWQNIKSRKIERGGSTITEQYIKNTYFPDAPRTLSQKMKESIAAYILESKISKQEILKNYINSIYMGNGLYGIGSAIHFYYHDSLDENQMLNIIVRIKYPNINENTHYQAQSYRKMVAQKLNISTSDTDFGEKNTRTSKDTYPLITLRVIKEMTSYCRGEPNTLKEWTLTIPKDICTNTSNNIQLTIDPKLMKHAINTARGVLGNLTNRNVTNASILIRNPNNGTIIAYIGNIHEESRIDMIQRKRSVGSLLKPFVYLLALQRGADAEDLILDEKGIYETSVDGKYFIPENYNPKSYGPIKIREALGNSLNAATVAITDTLGIRNIYEFLFKQGILLEHDAGYYGYGISLGTVETTLENIVNSYGNLLKFKDPDTWQIYNILSDSRNRAKTFGISSILNTSIPLAVKTGTSTDFRDNWSVSYHPDAIIGVWVGNVDGSPMGDDVSGVTGAGPIWHQIAEYMITHDMIKNRKISVPIGVTQKSICRESSCNQVELMYTKKTQSPKSFPDQKIYYSHDFFGEITPENLRKWNILQ